MCHSLLACRASAEKSTDNLMGIPLYVFCCFSLVAFIILSLSLIFVSLINVSWGGFLGLFICFFSVLGVCRCMKNFSYGERRLLSSYSALASNSRAQALGCVSSVVVTHRLSCSMVYGIWDQTGVSRIARRILNHRSTREGLFLLGFILCGTLCTSWTWVTFLFPW